MRYFKDQEKYGAIERSLDIIYTNIYFTNTFHMFSSHDTANDLLK